jgi:hypothetical protein
MSESIKYDFSAALKTTQEKTNLKTFTGKSRRYDFSKALGIKPKQTKKNSDIDAFFNELEKLEYNGPDGRTSRTFNPIGALLTDELAKNFGASKGPKLPDADNPENRPLHTAIFPDYETGKKAGKFIISKIYDTAEGDIEKFASIFALGKLPNQLITKNEIAIKDRYVKALSEAASQDDINKTLENKENDITSALINETERLKNSNNNIQDLSSTSPIFGPTNRMLQGQDENFIEYANQNQLNKKESDTFLKDISADAKIMPLGGSVSNAELAKMKTQYISSAKKLVELRQSETATPEDAINNFFINTLNIAPTEGDFRSLAINTVNSLQDIVVGFDDIKNRLINFIGTGEGGLELAKDLLGGLATTPESLSDLVVATGFHPLPQFNRFTEEGKKRVEAAQQKIFDNPVLPVLTAVGLKQTATFNRPKVPKQIKNDLKVLDDFIEEQLDITDTAIKVKKGEISPNNVTTKAKVLSEKIKNPAVLENTLKIIKEGRDAKATGKGLSTKPLPQARIDLAVKEIIDLGETIFDAQNQLNNPYVTRRLTDIQKTNLQNSITQTSKLIVENAKLLGDDVTIQYLQGGFGITKEQAALAYKYIKTVAKEYAEGAIPKNLINTINGYTRNQSLIDPLKKGTKNGDFGIEFLRKTNSANEEALAMNTSGFQRIKTTLNKVFFDSGAEAQMVLDKLRKSKNPNIAKLAAIADADRSLLKGVPSAANKHWDEVSSNIYDKLSKSEQIALNDYINVKRENSLKIFHDTELPKLENKFKLEKNKTKKAKLKKEIDRIKNYKYTGDKVKGEKWEAGDGSISKKTVRGSSPWVQKGFPEEYLNRLESKETAAKIKNAANDYFNVYREMVDELLDKGLIDEETAIRYKQRDYSPKEYLEFVRGEKTYDVGNKKITVEDRGFQTMKTGSNKILYNNSRKLLYDTIASVHSKIANNSASKSLASLIDEQLDGVGYKLKNKDSRPKLGFTKLDYMENGVKKSIAVENQFMSGWLRTPPALQPQFTRIIGMLTGSTLVKYLATGYNPAFAIGNLFLDFNYIFLNQNKIYSNNMAKRFGQLTSDIVKNSRHAWKKDGPYIDYINEGGGMHMLSTGEKIGSPFKPDGTRTFGSHVGAWFGKLNEFSELSTRLAVRDRAIKAGYTGKEATHIARSYLDWGVSGQIGNAMDAFIPYSKAAFTVTRGLFKSVKQDPKSYALRVGQLTAAKYALDSWINSDKDKKEILTRIPDYVTFENQVIPLPYKLENKNGVKKDAYIKIPMDNGQQIVNGILNISKNIYNKEEVSDFNINTLKKIVGALGPLDLVKLPPSMLILLGWGYNKKFPYSTPIHRKNDNIKNNREKKNLDESLLATDVGNTFNLSPAKLQYTMEQLAASGNAYFAAGLGGYEWIRKQMSDEEVEVFDKNLSETLNLPLLDKRPIKEAADRFFGFAEDNDKYLKDLTTDIETRRAGMVAQHDNEIDAFFLSYNATKDEARKDSLLNNLNLWGLSVEENFGPNEYNRIIARYNARKALSNLDIAKGFAEYSLNDPPALRAAALAFQMVKYQEDFEHQMQIIEELKNISPIKRNKRTGWLNESTIEYFNAIMGSIYDGGLMNNKITIK